MRRLQLFLFSLSLLFMQISCVTFVSKQDKLRLKADLLRAEQAGALRCAPKEFALAKSEIVFFEAETFEIDLFAKAKHYEKAQKNVSSALEKSKDCPDIMQTSTKGPDLDLDGIVDRRDKCPNQAEDFDQFQDKDGCPDNDNDNDRIIDEIDKCPNIPEDFDEFEDEDGCPDNDNDKDGIPDHEDSCPNKAGMATKNGCPLLDQDGDSIEDLQDKCPQLAEDFNGVEDTDGCPDADIDGDGITDPLDKCPESAEDQDKFEDEDGCPELDNDKDGLIDLSDLCPNLSGSLDAKGCPDKDLDKIPDINDKCPDTAGQFQEGDFAHLNGCPLVDTDHDGIWDHLDKCPEHLGVAQLDNPNEHGCPKKYKKIVITEDRIEIKEKIHFASGKSKIMKDSFELLAEIADAIRSSNLSHLEIQGHTDSKGSRRFNQKLSQQRAAAVLNHLVKKEDIDKAIVEAIGYGEDNPLESNDSRLGRAQNRRVEFHIQRQ